MRKVPVTMLALFVLAGCGGSGSKAPNAPAAPTAFRRQVLASGLEGPVQYVASTADARIGYVLELKGRIRALVDDALVSAPVLDLTGTVETEGEAGLLGMALAPDFPSSRLFYLHYDTREEGAIQTRVSRFRMAADGLSATMDRAILRFPQPFSNHNGGSLHFGKDGFLYLAFGDGGSANDPGNRAQDPTLFLGKVLRIDPTGDDFPADENANYRVPPTNPFVNVPGVRSEIWDFGMRNPFRWTVDAQTGALIFGDVGQGAYEEIDVEPAGRGGRNYGWRMREGRHDSGNAGPLYPIPVTEPTLEYDHSVGASITGGYVVRTGTLGIKDRYLVGDFALGHLWSVPLDLKNEGTSVSSAALAEIRVESVWAGIVSIDPDAKGEPIVTEINAGRVSRLVPAPVL